MNTSIVRLFAGLAAVATSSILATQSQADPLTGRDLLKFSQRPMISTPIIDSSGMTIGVYAGHDEISTAYGFPNAANVITDYSGRVHGRRLRRQTQQPRRPCEVVGFLSQQHCRDAATARAKVSHRVRVRCARSATTGNGLQHTGTGAAVGCGESRPGTGRARFRPVHRKADRRPGYIRR